MKEDSKKSVEDSRIKLLSEENERLKKEFQSNVRRLKKILFKNDDPSPESLEAAETLLKVMIPMAGRLTEMTQKSGKSHYSETRVRLFKIFKEYPQYVPTGKVKLPGIAENGIKKIYMERYKYQPDAKTIKAALEIYKKK